MQEKVGNNVLYIIKDTMNTKNSHEKASNAYRKKRARTDCSVMEKKDTQRNHRCWLQRRRRRRCVSSSQTSARAPLSWSFCRKTLGGSTGTSLISGLTILASFTRAHCASSSPQTTPLCMQSNLPPCPLLLQHPQVQENCIDLVGRIADRGPEHVNAREWMRICFELLEMLKAPKKTIQRAAANTFGYIAKAIGPQDVLRTLLNNLKVGLGSTSIKKLHTKRYTRGRKQVISDLEPSSCVLGRNRS